MSIRIAFALIGLASSVLWNQLMLCVVVLTEHLDNRNHVEHRAMDVCRDYTLLLHHHIILILLVLATSSS